MSYGRFALAVAALFASGCGLVLGLGDYTEQETTGEIHDAGGSGSGGSTSNSASGTSQGGGGDECPPKKSEPCYEGSIGTEDIGLCKGGTRTCNEEGTAWSECKGQVLPEQEDCAQPADEDCSGLACSQPLWSSIHGDGSFQRPNGMAVDGSGNVYVTGNFVGKLAFGDTTLQGESIDDDIFLAKLDAQGAPLWAQKFAAAGAQRATSIAIDKTGNIAITGDLWGAGASFGGASVDNGMFVAVFDSNGSHKWSKNYGGFNYCDPEGGCSFSGGSDIAFDPSGDVLVTGTFDSMMNFGNGPLSSAGRSDIFLAKIDGQTGVGVWSQRFGDSKDQIPSSVAADSAGNVYLAGSFDGSILFGGVTVTSTGKEMFVAKLSDKGSPAWIKDIGEAGSAVAPTDLSVDPGGNAVVTGVFSSSVDFGSGAVVSTSQSSDLFIAKYSATGLPLWSKRFGDGMTQVGTGVDANADTIVLTGAFAGSIDFGGGNLTSQGGNDLLVAKLTSDGSHVWSRSFGDAKEQTGDSIAIDATTQAVLMTGTADGSINFGTGLLVSGGKTDVVVAKFAP